MSFIVSENCQNALEETDVFRTKKKRCLMIVPILAQLENTVSNS